MLKLTCSKSHAQGVCVCGGLQTTKYKTQIITKYKSQSMTRHFIILTTISNDLRQNSFPCGVDEHYIRPRGKHGCAVKRNRMGGTTPRSQSLWMCSREFPLGTAILPQGRCTQEIMC